MGISYTIDHERRLILARGEGLVTDEDFFDYVFGLWQIPDSTSLDEIIDMSGVEHFAMTSDGLRRVAALVDLSNRAGAPYHVAVIAPADVVYGMFRMYSVFREPIPGTVQVFRSSTEAFAWLQLSRRNWR